MFFADDIVLVNESRDGVNAKLKRWLKNSRALQVVQRKKNMDSNFSGDV